MLLSTSWRRIWTLGSTNASKLPHCPQNSPTLLIRRSSLKANNMVWRKGDTLEPNQSFFFCARIKPPLFQPISNFGFVHSAFSVTETLFILLAGGIPWVRNSLFSPLPVALWPRPMPLLPASLHTCCSLSFLSVCAVRVCQRGMCCNTKSLLYTQRARTTRGRGEGEREQHEERREPLLVLA